MAKAEFFKSNMDALSLLPILDAALLVTYLPTRQLVSSLGNLTHVDTKADHIDMMLESANMKSTKKVFELFRIK